MIAKQMWDPKDLGSLKATPIQNARVNKKDVEDFQKILDNLNINGKASESMASPNWLMVTGKFSFPDFMRVLQVINYARVSLDRSFEGFTIESML
jgi:hypothetical protein